MYVASLTQHRFFVAAMTNHYRHYLLRQVEIPECHLLLLGDCVAFLFFCGDSCHDYSKLVTEGIYFSVGDSPWQMEARAGTQGKPACFPEQHYIYRIQVTAKK